MINESAVQRGKLYISGRKRYLGEEKKLRHKSIGIGNKCRSGNSIDKGNNLSKDR